MYSVWKRWSCDDDLGPVRLPFVLREQIGQTRQRLVRRHERVRLHRHRRPHFHLAATAAPAPPAARCGSRRRLRLLLSVHALLSARPGGARMSKIAAPAVKQTMLRNDFIAARLLFRGIHPFCDVILRMRRQIADIGERRPVARTSEFAARVHDRLARCAREMSGLSRRFTASDDVQQHVSHTGQLPTLDGRSLDATKQAVCRLGASGGGQNTAIGFTGEPLPPSTGIGANVSMNS